MRTVDLINKFILPHYDRLYTESREYLIEDVIERCTCVLFKTVAAITFILKRSTFCCKFTFFLWNHKRNPPKNLHKREILLIFALSLQELRGKDENMKQENNRIQLPLEEIKLAFAASCVEGAARKLGVPYIEIYERMRKVDLINKFILPHYDTLHTESREYLIEDVIECLTNWEKKDRWK